METLTWVIPATNGTYTSPDYNPQNSCKFSYVLDIEFYNDHACTIPSTGMTGSIAINGKSSQNGVWCSLPDSSTPSTVDASNAQFLQFAGKVYQLQAITNTLTNTNYVKFLLNIIPSRGV